MLKIIFGGQFGSEGKGLAASMVARDYEFPISTTDAGPNAGHTAVMPDYTKVVTFHLPMAGVLNTKSKIYLNGGAIIDPIILEKEVATMDKMGFEVSKRLFIHPKAAIITPNHVKMEKDPTLPIYQIASTQKGVGAAAASKVLRDGITAGQSPSLNKYIDYMDVTPHSCIEVAQGFSLGCNTQFYPFSTMRCCTPAQGMMNAGVPTQWPHLIIAVIRVNPIRVGNIPGGYSGDVYPDQEETSWSALGLEPQYTTVTNRMRRVFTYSPMQTRDMMKVCKPNVILINFCNHTAADRVQHIAEDIYKAARELGMNYPRLLYGYGPKAEDIKHGIQ